MSAFGKILRELRTENNLTQIQLAQKIGVAFSTISMYERGEREPDFETMEAIADYFNVTMDYLHGKSDKKYYKSDNDNLPSPNITEDYTTFAVIGEVAAGYDSIAIEDWEGETVDIPNSWLRGRDSEEFFVLKVKGDSMYPTYQEGDKVLVLKQSTLNYSGQVGVILYDDEYASLKKVEYKMGEDWLRMVPINPTHPIKKVDGEELEHCRILGIPKMLIREIEE